MIIWLKMSALYFLVLVMSLFYLSEAAFSASPSFDCSKVEENSIEETICNDEQLSRLDLELAEVYKEAEKEAVNEKPPVLKAEQRGWIKGRNDCWKAENVKDCIKTNYQLRIAELQAKYRLIYNSGPLFYTCDNNPANELVITLFGTDPRTLIAEYGDQTSLMYKQPNGPSMTYKGQNQTVWIKGHKVIEVQWGFDAETMKCKAK